jgi:hypothetical protein
LPNSTAVSIIYSILFSSFLRALLGKFKTTCVTEKGSFFISEIILP